MTRRVHALALVIGIGFGLATAAAAAPLPPFRPVDICGAVVERVWVPAEIRRGQPGMSGSLGRDRTFPAHLRLVLESYTGIDAVTARRINFLLGAGAGRGDPQRLQIHPPTDDPAWLTGVRRICVEGFSISGDEGGTWTSFRRATAAPGPD